MDELVAFLRAALDRDEALAIRVAERYRVRNPDREDDGRPFWPLPSVQACFRGPVAPDIAAGLELIESYSPARVLAEVQAKRRILELADHYTRKAAEDRAEGHPSRAVENIRDTYRSVLLDLAQPYAGQPGWRAEWQLGEPA